MRRRVSAGRLRHALVLAGAAAAAALPGCGEGERGEEPTGRTSAAIGSCAEVAGDNFEYQDDACRRKRVPSNRERTIVCPIASSSAAGFAPSTSPVVVDENALRGIVPDELYVTVILVRRVGGVPMYRYLSNGTHDRTFQPWSSTKHIAVAGAAARLRRASGGAVGLTASTEDGTPLGDLVTTITSYREQRFTSNGLARYFLNIAGRDAAQSLIRDWLKRPADESYGGNYGFAAPDLGYSFAEPSGARVSVEPDDRTGIVNRLSTFTLAELTKRLATWDDAATRLPYVQPSDLEVLFYGAKTSKAYPGELGGMHADLSIYVQAALDMGRVEAESRGRFRTFGKLGFGNGELVHVSHTCMPVLDAANAPLVDRGAEFVIATRWATGGASWAERDQILGSIYAKLVQKGILPNAQPPPGTASDAAAPSDAGGAPPRPRAEDDDDGASSVATRRPYAEDADGGCHAAAAARIRPARTSAAPVAAALGVALVALRRRRRRGERF